MRRDSTSALNIGRYEIEEKIGCGGMAEVFTALFRGPAGFERRVCVKRILPQLAADREFRELFVKEVALAGRLTHSNLVQVFDCIEEGDTLAIVMEAVEGVDLGRLLRERRRRGQSGMSTGLAVHVVGQLLAGLRYAHGQRVIHRDVSPQNILISRQGEVKLADFGVAKAMLTHVSWTGNLKGKLPYMSPEQARGGAVDHRTDLYSAGLVLVELLTGRRYFERAGSRELLGRISNPGPPRLPTGLAPSLSMFLERLIAPAPRDRFECAEAAIEALPGGEVLGPRGAVELGGFLRDHRSSGEAVEPPSPRGVRSGDEVRRGREIAGREEEVELARTERLCGEAPARELERPVVAGSRDAVTKTRKTDVRQALALATTQVVVAGCAPPPLYPDTIEDAVFAERHVVLFEADGLLAGFGKTLPSPGSREAARAASLVAHDGFLGRGLRRISRAVYRGLFGLGARRVLAGIVVIALSFGLVLGLGGRLLWSRAERTQRMTVVERNRQEGSIGEVTE